MAIRSRLPARSYNRQPEPMSELNIKPLIDVLLVLLVMLILSIPMAVQRLDVDLPGPPREDSPVPTYEQVSLVVQESGAVLWNGEAVSWPQLQNNLAAAARQPEMPLIRFEPAANASYNDSVQVINAVADAHLDKFAFVGNQQYAVFGSD